MLTKVIFYNLLPNGKRLEGYGTHRLGVELFKEDWEKIFSLLEDGKTDPSSQLNSLSSKCAEQTNCSKVEV